MKTAANRPSDLALVSRQLAYEQLSFWRNPFAAVFTVGFSVIFLVLLGASGNSDRIDFLGNIRAVDYYVPGFVAYGVMSACFNTLAISLVTRRETGLLKRLRLSPLPTWVALAAILANSVVVSALQVVLLVAIGRLAYHVPLPHNPIALALAVVVGVVCFAALGVAAANVIPNQESAGPLLAIVFFVLLYLSGLWFPLKAGSALARISAWFPVRHFMLATFAPFDRRPGHGPFAWADLAQLALWGAIGVVVAARRFRWEPRPK
jgi:ABC-2 type transport system permease protein